MVVLLYFEYFLAMMPMLLMLLLLVVGGALREPGGPGAVGAVDLGVHRHVVVAIIGKCYCFATS